MAGIILTGVDGSDSARMAAEKAATLAVALGSELHVVSAFTVSMSEMFQTVRTSNDPTVIGNAVKKLTEEHSGEAERSASETAAALRTKFPDLKIVSRAVEGAPGSVLVSEAEANQAEMIVVGNKRVQGPGRVLGSVARTVASETTCDLYVVHTHQR